MAPPMLSTLIKRGVDILSTALDAATNTISAQLGDVLAGIATSHNAEWIQHVGFASRPAKAVPGQGAAQAWIITSSDRDFCFASRDTRGTAIYGNLKDGECCVYAPASQARTMYKADGSITHYTTADNTATGTAVYQRIATDSFTWAAPWGTLQWSAKGLIVKDASGAMLVLAPPASAPPGLLSSVKSIARLLSDATEVLGNATFKCGITGGVCAPIAAIPSGLPVTGTNGVVNPSGGAMVSV